MTKKKKPEDIKPPGPKPFEPTPEQRKMVATLSGLGVPQTGICLLLENQFGQPISQDTLARHFRADLNRGVEEANTKIAGELFKQAMAGNMTAIIFWLKTRARWKETPQQHAFTDPDGNPAPPPSLGDFYASIAKVSTNGSEVAGGD